jgi:predicted O-methyltransferase YrrM
MAGHAWGAGERNFRVTVAPGEQPTNVLNVLRFAARNPSRIPVLVHKVLKRLRGENDKGSPENDAWLDAHSTTAEQIAKSLDAKLWAEACAIEAEFQDHARSVLGKIPHDLGGGGDYKFLYWLTRYRRPKVVVETGVAAGWSSRALLLALKKNRKGRLYSSDLPYFRLPNPERFVGVLVEDDLRKNWALHIEGDEVNLPRILADVPHVDIFHYDSDKMASGREYAISLVRSKLAPDGIILVDDIRNDEWFKCYVTANKTPFSVVSGRYGIIGSVKRP